MRKKCLALYLALCLGMLSGLAQVPHFLPHELPQDLAITCLAEDSSGFVWAGTADGVFRYDGHDWDLFPSADTASAVTTLAFLSTGELWAGYEDGRLRFLENGQMQPYTAGSSLPSTAITGIATDGAGVMWVSTYGEGVFYLQDGQLQAFGKADGLVGVDIYTLTVDGQGRIWAGSDLGISICEWVNGEKKGMTLTKEDGLPDNIVQALAPDDQGYMWIGMYEGGIARYDIATGEFFIPTTQDEWPIGAVTALFPVHDALWIGTARQGLWAWEGERLQPLLEGRRYRVTQVLPDCQGNVWAAGKPFGLVSAQARFAFVPEVQGNVKALTWGREDRLWYSTAEGLYAFLHPTGVVKKHDLPVGLNIISLYEDHEGYLWIGTFGKGVYRYAPTSGTYEVYTEADGLVNENVLSITGIRDKVWFATLGGVACCQLDGSGEITFENFDHTRGLGANYIYGSFIDSKSRVWFATDGKGVSVWEKGTFRSFADEGLVTAFSITEDPDGNIWFNAGEEGLWVYEGDSLRAFEHPILEGVEDITAISCDAYGRLVLVLPNGVAFLTPTTGQLTMYGADLLLDAIQPDLNILAPAPNGDFWLGTQKGLLRVVPPSDGRPIRPITRLKDVQVLLSPIGTQDPAKLAHDQNFVSFDYAGLWYHAPDQVLYAYRLEGLSPNWIITRDRKVSFPKLAPGKYTFELKSSPTGEFEAETALSYSFRIQLPIWKQAWFVLLLLLGIGLAIGGLIRLRERRLRKEERLEKERIEFQFETLRSQVNPHFLFNSFNTLITIIEEDRETAVDYVEKLSDFFRAMLEYESQQTISLAEELRLLDDYYFLQQKRYGTNFSLTINLPDDLSQRQIVPLCLQMLIENALKHNIVSQKKPLLVTIAHQGDYLSITNNLQKKRKPVASTGVGLQNITRRYALLSDQTVRVREERDTFEVWLPLL